MSHKPAAIALAGFSVIAISIALSLIACSDNQHDDPKPQETPQELADRVQAKAIPVKIAEVDGVKLWKVRDYTPNGTSYVYFTTHGTYEEHSCGKNCVEHNMVPNDDK